MPPVVAALTHRGEGFVAAGARASLHDDNVLDSHAFLERFVGVALERHGLTATITAVRGDQHFRLRVVDAITQRLRREAAKDNGMNGADARAREHRDCRFWHERHVNGHAVAALHAELLQHVRELLHLDVEVPIGECATIARLAFPDDCRFVASRRLDVPVDAIVRNIDLAADEPSCARRVPLEDFVPATEPVQRLGRLGPVGLGVLRGGFVDGVIRHVRVAPEFAARSELSVLLQKDVDVGHDEEG